MYIEVHRLCFCVPGLNLLAILLLLANFYVRLTFGLATCKSVKQRKTLSFYQICNWLTQVTPCAEVRFMRHTRSITACRLWFWLWFLLYKTPQKSRNHIAYKSTFTNVSSHTPEMNKWVIRIVFIFFSFLFYFVILFSVFYSVTPISILSFLLV